MFSTNFPNQKSFILLYLIKWQYFWWFWFSYLFLFYYSIFFNKILQQSMRSNPKIVTSQKAHGKWGDVIICFLPVFWCINILTNSNSLLKSIEWQTESNSLVIRVRGKQWFWLYKIDPSDISKLMESNIVLGSGKLYNNYISSECKFDKLLNKSSSMLSVGSPNPFGSEDSVVLLGVVNKPNGGSISPLHTSLSGRLKTPLLILRTDFISGSSKNFLSILSDSFDTDKNLNPSNCNKNSSTLSNGIIHSDYSLVLRSKKLLRCGLSSFGGNYSNLDRDNTSLSSGISNLTSIFKLNNITITGEVIDGSSSFLNNYDINNFKRYKKSQTTFINRFVNSIEVPNLFRADARSFNIKDSFIFDYRLGNSPRGCKIKELSIFSNYDSIKNSRPITLKLWSSNDSSEFNISLCKNPLESGDLVSFVDGSKSKEVYRRRYFTISQKSKKSGYNHSISRSLLVGSDNLVIRGETINTTNSRDGVIANYSNTVNLPSSKREVFYNTRNNQRLLHVDNLLILPTHTNLTIITNSYDVVHSWFVPGLGLKMDCVPGRSTHHSLYVRTPGFYYGQCAEICGRLHHHMPIKVCFLPLDHFFIWWNHFYFKHCKSARNFIFKLN